MNMINMNKDLMESLKVISYALVCPWKLPKQRIGFICMGSLFFWNIVGFYLLDAWKGNPEESSYLWSADLNHNSFWIKYQKYFTENNR